MKREKWNCLGCSVDNDHVSLLVHEEMEKQVEILVENGYRVGKNPRVKCRFKPGSCINVR